MINYTFLKVNTFALKRGGVPETPKRPSRNPAATAHKER